MERAHLAPWGELASFAALAKASSKETVREREPSLLLGSGGLLLIWCDCTDSVGVRDENDNPCSWFSLLSVIGRE